MNVNTQKKGDEQQTEGTANTSAPSISPFKVLCLKTCIMQLPKNGKTLLDIDEVVESYAMQNNQYLAM